MLIKKKSFSFCNSQAHSRSSLSLSSDEASSRPDELRPSGFNISFDGRIAGAQPEKNLEEHMENGRT